MMSDTAAGVKRWTTDELSRDDRLNSPLLPELAARVTHLFGRPQ